MRILLSNDDGYFAPGLEALAQAVSRHAEITVVAPERDRSGASNSLTLDRPLMVRRAPNGFLFVNGTPTDCVHLAVTGLLDHQPDMVISGINLGANMGDDTIYSGTVAAATLDGIVAVNDVNTDQLSITATDVFGRSGIIALNYGTGATQVVSTGRVAGFEADGVRVQNDTAATNVLIDVNDVVGGNNGINVVNFGSGLTRVISDGVVTGGAGNGVAVQTGTASQSLVVEVNEVHGQENGIILNNVGSGVTASARPPPVTLPPSSFADASARSMFSNACLSISGPTSVPFSKGLPIGKPA